MKSIIIDGSRTKVIKWYVKPCMLGCLLGTEKLALLAII